MLTLHCALNCSILCLFWSVLPNPSRFALQVLGVLLIFFKMWWSSTLTWLWRPRHIWDNILFFVWRDGSEYWTKGLISQLASVQFISVDCFHQLSFFSLPCICCCCVMQISPMWDKCILLLILLLLLLLVLLYDLYPGLLVQQSWLVLR